MDILTSKDKIVIEINSIYERYQTYVSQETETRIQLETKLTDMNALHKKLHQEIKDKDKLLAIHDKKLLDYETMINHIQEEATKEMNEKEKFSMLRVQDKEINQKNNEISILQKKVSTLENKLKTLTNEGSIIETITPEDTQEDTSGEQVPNFIYEDGTTSGDDNSSDIVEEDKDDDVKDDDVTVDEGESWKRLSKKMCEKDEEDKVVEGDKVEDDKVEDDDKDDEDDEDDEDDDITVSVITHYKKKYYIIEGESPQYIYAIEDGDLGDKVGEMIVNDGRTKKKFYDISSKN